MCFLIRLEQTCDNKHKKAQMTVYHHLGIGFFFLLFLN